jgi:hypothetical protein
MTTPAPPPQIADVLATNLEIVFEGLCEHRYGGPISLERVAPHSTTARFRLYRAGLPELRADFEIRHVGGNVYDVRGTIDDGPSQTFTYSLPEPPPDRPRAPRLAHDVAAFLLDALERRVGNDLLRSQTRGRDRRQPSPPDRSIARSPSPSQP